MANKVLFGFSDLYIGTYEDNNGTVTLGAPYHQAGAVGYSPESSNDANTFYADNVAYYTAMGNGSMEGDLEVAMFDDALKPSSWGMSSLMMAALHRSRTLPNRASISCLPYRLTRPREK